MRPRFSSSVDWSEGVQIGRYLVYDRIASGGQASVHIGRLAGVGGFARVVAIKMLHEHAAADPRSVTGMLDEARLLASVRHPNVVGTSDILEDGDVIALVMEYVLGAPLNEVVAKVEERRATIPVPIAIAIVAQVLHGLGAAHDARDPNGNHIGLVHRDVSPQNVLLGTDGLARVIDFGIALGTTRLQKTANGEVRGKIAYMAPEQLLGAPIDRRTDIFAVGVVLWELLSSARLFLDQSEGLTLANVLHKEIPAPLTGGFASRAVNDVVLRALERDPSRRFQTCEEMADALEETMAVAKPREIANWLAEVEPVAMTERRQLLQRIEGIPLASPAPQSQRLSRMLGAVGDPSPAPPPAAAQAPLATTPSDAPAGAKAPSDAPAGAKAPSDAPAGAKTPRPRLRRISSSNAITQVRLGSKPELEEIRRLYASGDVTTALKRAETVRVGVNLGPRSVLRVHLPPAELMRLPLDHRAGFMLTRIDGESDLETVLSVAAMPEHEAIEILERLLTIGAVGLVGATSPPRSPSDAPTLTPRRSER